MAKKAKAKATTKAKTKTKAKAKTGASRAADTKVPMHAVVHFVRMLNNRSHAAKFIAHAKKNQLSVTVSPKGVKAINNFLQAKSLTTARTLRGIDACPTIDPFKCPR
jgi:hypothetical protein